MKPKLNPDDKARVAEVAAWMGVTASSQRTTFERLGFRVCGDCGRFHRPDDGCNKLPDASSPLSQSVKE